MLCSKVGLAELFQHPVRRNNIVDIFLLKRRMFFSEKFSGNVFSNGGIICQLWTMKTSTSPEIRTSGGICAMAGQRPEIMDCPYDRTDFTELLDVVNSKKISMSIVNMDQVNVMFFDETDNFQAAIGDAETGITVIPGDKPIEKQHGHGRIQNMDAFF